jgi:hypothetical protein
LGTSSEIVPGGWTTKENDRLSQPDLKRSIRLDHLAKVKK